MIRWVFAVELLVGCTPLEQHDPHPRFTDMAGGEFFHACNKRGLKCEVHRIAGVSPRLHDCENPNYFPGYGFEPVFALDWSRFITVAPYCFRQEHEDLTSSLDALRPLVCTTDDDCLAVPTDVELAPYECREGVCQNTDYEVFPPELLYPMQVEMLCFASAPYFEPMPDEWYAALYAELDLVCPSRNVDWFVPCDSVPAECPDPR